MLEAKISLDSNNACDKCGRKFRNEEEIYCFYENKKFYCDECTDEMKEEGAIRFEMAPFVFWFVTTTMFVLVKMEFLKKIGRVIIRFCI